MIKTVIKSIIPLSLYKLLRKNYFRFKNKPHVHLTNVFGFDLYQNDTDLDYTKFIGASFESPPLSPDGRIFFFMKLFLGEGDVAIDVGANIGLMSLYMARICGSSGKVISIEPGPVSSALLKRNLFVNGALTTNTVLINAAVSDFSGVIPLFICASGESDNQTHKGMESYEFRGELERLKIEVEAQTLDEIIFDNLGHFDRVRFIKIDTQGHEYYVIKGASKVLSESTDIAVLCEYAPYLKSWEKIDINEFFNLLKSFNFLIFDSNNIEFGEIDLDYLTTNFGFDKVGKYTDLLLVKGGAIIALKKNMLN